MDDNLKKVLEKGETEGVIQITKKGTDRKQL